MKKIFLIISFFVIALSGFSQFRPSGSNHRDLSFIKGRLKLDSIPAASGSFVGLAEQTSDSTVTQFSIATGIYIPILSNSQNVSATTVDTCLFERIGNIVRVTGRVHATTGGIAGSGFNLTLPIASNLGSQTITGNITATAAVDLGYISFGNGNTANFGFQSNASGPTILYFTFTYLVQ